MDSKQIFLVQDSFQYVAPIADTAAELFYRRLFELDSSLRPLFKGDITEQGKKLMSTLAMVVNSLDKIDTIAVAVQKLGRTHATYGVQPSHYQTVGEALLWTLEQGLGDKFTPEVKSAWTEAYTLLATVMTSAAAEATKEGTA